MIKGQDVVTGAVAFDLRYPSDLPREVGSVHLFEALLLKLEDHFFAAVAELAIQEVSLGRVELPNETLDDFWTNFLGLELGWRFDKKLGSFCKSLSQRLRVLCGRMLQQVSLDRIHDYYAALAGECAFPAVACNAPWISAVLEPGGTLSPCFFQPKYAVSGGDLGDALNSPSSR